MKSWCLPDDTVEAVLEPLEGLGAGDLVVGAEGGLAAAALGDVLTRAGPIKVSLSLPLPSFHFWFDCRALTCSSRSPYRRYQYRGRT